MIKLLALIFISFVNTAYADLLRIRIPAQEIMIIENNSSDEGAKIDTKDTEEDNKIEIEEKEIENNDKNDADNTADGDG